MYKPKVPLYSLVVGGRPPVCVIGVGGGRGRQPGSISPVSFESTDPRGYDAVETSVTPGVVIPVVEGCY